MKNDELKHIEGVAALENNHYNTTNEIKRQCIFLNWQGGLNLALLALALFFGYNWCKQTKQIAEMKNYNMLTDRIVDLEWHLIELVDVIAEIKGNPPDINAGL